MAGVDPGVDPWTFSVVSFSTYGASCGGMESCFPSVVSLMVSEDSLSDVDTLVDLFVVTESSLKRCERPGVESIVDTLTLLMSDSCMQQWGAAAKSSARLLLAMGRRALSLLRMHVSPPLSSTYRNGRLTCLYKSFAALAYRASQCV